MSSNRSSGIKKFFTLITAPIWVPVAAVGGILGGVAVGVVEGNEIGKEKGPLTGIAATPVAEAAGAIVGTFATIVAIGDELWGDDESEKG